MNLTTRELEVLKLLCLPRKTISERLCISLPTTRRHIEHIFNKLVCSNRVEALVKAIKIGIIKADEVITD